LTGRAGERSNAFLEGFTEELQKGTVANFLHYICQICAVPRGSISCSDEDISRAVKTNGIYCYSLEEWEGFLPELWSERDELQKNIAQLRTERKTFKHDRQVKAEAEALIIIKNFRKKLFSIKDHPVSNSYFVSHTRVIDEVAGPGFSVTMRPEAVLQWITTINPCTLEELQLLTANLLTELSERNCDIIDKNKLYNVFAPLISASKEKLEEELEHHRALISNRYGEKAVSAFHETSSLHMPIVLESYYVQKTEFLTKELQKEKIRTVTMKAATELTEKERNELTRLRTEKRLKQTKAARKKKHSNPKKKKKKNKR
jgi:hypothetical protein